MALILNIETSTEVCSVCLSKDGKSMFTIDDDSSNSHSKILIVLIEKIFKQANITLSNLDAIAISDGPGSYTGLRIGMATAKALCYSAEKPLITISSLHSLVNGLIQRQTSLTGDFDFIVIPMIDARRMEVYTAVYNQNLNELEPICAKIIDESSFKEHLEHSNVFFVGTGAEKCKTFFQNHPNARFDDTKTSASHMIQLSEMAFSNQNFANLAYCEPFYLKDYIAGKPNVKGLR